MICANEEMEANMTNAHQDTKKNLGLKNEQIINTSGLVQCDKMGEK